MSKARAAYTRFSLESYLGLLTPPHLNCFFHRMEMLLNNSLDIGAYGYRYREIPLLCRLPEKSVHKQKSISVYKEFLYKNTTVRNLRHKWHGRSGWRALQGAGWVFS